MTKLSPMKNKRAENKTAKQVNFKTHKNDRNFGHVTSRKMKQDQRWCAWSE